MFIRYPEVEIDVRFVVKFKLVSNLVKSKYLYMLIEFDEKREKQIAPHLSRKDLNFSKHAQMDVKPALNIFNQATADAIEFMVKAEGWPEEAMTTARHISLMAEMYKIMGSYDKNYAFDVKKPERRQEFIDFLNMFMDYYSSLKFDPEKQN